MATKMASSQTEQFGVAYKALVNCWMTWNGADLNLGVSSQRSTDSW